MRQLNLNAIGASAIYKAVSEFTLFETAPERTDRILAALAKADLVIVPKMRGNPDAVREAVRTGNWSAVSERDLLAWRDAPREEETAPVAEGSERDEPFPTGRVLEVVYAKPDGTTETVRHTEFMRQGGLSFDPPSVVGMRALEVRVSGATETVALVPGNTFELPPGTEIRAADAAAPEPERDYSGLRENGADDLAARYGCRVEIVGMDDADMPLTDEGIVGDPQYVVVTERATGRHVALVEAWETEDGDPIVPKRWLEIVLGAWDAARDPQQAA